MRALVVGASGFIGRHVVAALKAAGHDVVPVSRRAASTERGVALDVTAIRRPADWFPALDRIDAVVYAVGIFREAGRQTFQCVHVEGPRLLYEACRMRGVGRVVQVSALGADGGAASAYHRSKRAADLHLLSLPLAATIVQPSLVFGGDGASARLFARWASLPLVPVPGDGSQRIQPVHIEDVAQAIVRVLADDRFVGRTVALAGPQPVTVRNYLARLRRAIGLGPPRFVDIPMPWVRVSARCLSRWPSTLVDEAAVDMLVRGNVASADDMCEALGRPPRPIEAFLDGPREAWRAWAVGAWALPMLRVAVATVWILTALLSFGLFPVDESLMLLARVGASGEFARLLLYGSATLDLLLGAAALFAPPGRRLWGVQFALILGYTVLITWRLPEFWLHPFGPILKNVPMLAAIALLRAMEARSRWTT